MSVETLDYGHWVIDHPLEDIGFKRNLLLITESIQSQILEISTRVKDDSEGELNQDTAYRVPVKKEIINPFILTKRRKLNYNKETQHWVGYITTISSNGFYANLQDRIPDDDTIEVAEFDFSEVSKSDYKLVKLGAIFYYSIGFVNDNGQIKKESFIRFQRSIPFEIEDVDEIEGRIAKLKTNINWD